MVLQNTLSRIVIFSLDTKFIREKWAEKNWQKNSVTFLQNLIFFENVAHSTKLQIVHSKKKRMKCNEPFFTFFTAAVVAFSKFT